MREKPVAAFEATPPANDSEYSAEHIDYTIPSKAKPELTLVPESGDAEVIVADDEMESYILNNAPEEIIVADDMFSQISPDQLTRADFEESNIIARKRELAAQGNDVPGIVSIPNSSDLHKSPREQYFETQMIEPGLRVNKPDDGLTIESTEPVQAKQIDTGNVINPNARRLTRADFPAGPIAEMPPLNFKPMLPPQKPGLLKRLLPRFLGRFFS